MAISHLLPCACGEKIKVDAAQAGLSVTCVCGRQLDVPTRRGLADLEIAPDDPLKNAPRRAWGPRHGVALLGMAIAVIALGCGLLLWANAPQDFVTQRIAEADLIDSLRFWHSLKEGVHISDTPENVGFKRATQNYRFWMIFSFIAAGVGLLITLGALFVRHAGTPRINA